jgi:hypothetical protein
LPISLGIKGHRTSVLEDCYPRSFNTTSIRASISEVRHPTLSLQEPLSTTSLIEAAFKMYFTVFITALVTLASTTIAEPLEARQNKLKPWKVTALSTFSPSGRPGSYPWLTITANLTDPNALTLGTSPDNNDTVSVPAGGKAINCQAKWLSGETPFGRSWPCDLAAETSGYWTVKIVAKNDFSVNNFDAVFTRVAEVLYQGAAYKKVFEAQAHFAVGENLGGTCGGSGVCSWGLKSELVPYKVQQHEVIA